MAAEPEGLSELARAKINLCLHVTGRRADGRHLLDSLVVFPEIGDRLRAAPSPIPLFSVEGRFAAALEGERDNLVTRAASRFTAALEEPRAVALVLEKLLPVASGMGGGSADAAAALRLLARLLGRTLPQADLADLALELGADVPVCLDSAPRRMRGTGEILCEAPAFPGFWLTLVNPGLALSTAQVFAALTRRDQPPLSACPDRFASLRRFIDWLARQRNDLALPARALAPPVGRALDALEASEGCLLARMSGSGATCFGIFAEERPAFAAARAIAAVEPGWWTAHARVKPWSGAPD